MMRPTPSSTLFPYTTLFRSARIGSGDLPPRRDASHFAHLGRQPDDRECRTGRLARQVDEHPHRRHAAALQREKRSDEDRKSTRLNSSHVEISYAVFCLKKKK